MKTKKMSRVYDMSERSTLLWGCQPGDDTGGKKAMFHIFDLPPPMSRGRSG